jgi:hypothetical protein
MSDVRCEMSEVGVRRIPGFEEPGIQGVERLASGVERPATGLLASVISLLASDFVCCPT